jgi:hypothetical protein
VSSQPSSFLLLPIAGKTSAANFQASVETLIDPALLDDWLPAAEAAAVRGRISNRLAAWGLRDNTRELAGSGVQPLSWDRIVVGTLALFSNQDEYICQAQVIGKFVSERASQHLWESPEFRWLVLLSDVRDISIPLDVVREALGYDPTYRMNRQNIVPRARREEGLREALANLIDLPPEPARVRLVPPEGMATEVFEVRPTEPREAQRREAQLVDALRAWWISRDGPEAVWRIEIRPRDAGAILHSDLFNSASRELVEAKADCARESVRMAIGQLADYRRFVDEDVSCKILLPAEPTEDLADLLALEGIGILIPDGATGFRELSASLQTRALSATLVRAT